MTVARPIHLSTYEAAAVIGMGESSVRRAADSGCLPSTRGRLGARRFLPADVEAYKANRTSGYVARSVRAAEGRAMERSRFDFTDDEEL
jgi:hypothetical protein